MTTFLDDETLALYIEESKEHLESIESDLLELEKQGEQFDEDLVNKVFRAAHSIKGGGGFLGLNTIKALAHKIENILHLIRTDQLLPGSDLINVLLAAYDRLGELIDNPSESNNADISLHINRLEAAASGDPEEGASQTGAVNFTIRHPKLDIEFTLNEHDIRDAQQGGKQIYILDFDLIQDVHKQNKTPFDLITMMEDSGIIVDISTSIDGCGDLFSDIEMPVISLCVLYSTIVEPDLVGILYNLDDSKVALIEKDKIKPTESPATENLKKDPAPVAAKQTASADQLLPREELPVSTPEEQTPDQKEIAKKPASKPTSITSETLRVNVSILDQLMNRAGELVLARNQLLQAVQTRDHQSLVTAGQRVDLVTSELQETIMLTRMQPVGIVFNKFPRLARGLAMDLGKKIDLQLEGTDVELDKTIIEGLADPLTHLVRNSADHGIELPDVREQKGKPRIGKINLRAYYESGQVLIEINDDGKGLDPEKIAAKAVNKGLCSDEEISGLSDKEKLGFIMLPGFSTAEQVTDVSGRGVGMDVVKTNLDKMGGQVELLSEVDRGTTIRIKLPLTLAIIPSLLVQATQKRFAVPQANVAELLRIPAADIRQRVEKVGDADVLILRGELIPLLQLNNVLKLNPSYYDYKTGTFKSDRRSGVVDQRLIDESHSHADPQSTTKSVSREKSSGITTPERRRRRDSDIVIVILTDGSQKYGLIVDSVSDSVEIVVKPLGRHLAGNKAYAGATIMGDGHVALILDIRGMAELADLKSVAESERDAEKEEEPTISIGATRQTLLIFHNGPDESCAVPLAEVIRVERIKATDIEVKGGKKIIQYRGGSLTIYALEEVANVEMLEAGEKLIVIIFRIAGHEIGLLAVQPLDVVDQELVLDDRTLRQPGIAGSTIVNGKTTLLVDIHELVKILNPHWFQDPTPHTVITPSIDRQTAQKGSILLVEDSQFFRNQVKGFLEDVGYSVIEAEDGQQAWDFITEHPASVFLVVTDLEMPNMDGFEFTRQLKSDSRFSDLPVIALTSLAAEEDKKRGQMVGIDDYQVKLDKEKLLLAIKDFLNT